MRLLTLIAVLYLLAGCSGGPPTFSVTLTGSALVVRVRGHTE